ncbi:flagellar filament capping protein FliD [Thalassotalea sp. PLHSN55]|uniref:flagellar filament capping protein FliD n=1 Tax=Thalassotalea sp. PLHSN55 TaxID=3435888 RepID=UPI003F85791D
MPSISFPGLGSGLQVSEIVSAIVGAERAPFESRLNQQAGKITTDISAVGALKSALEDVSNSITSLGDSDNYQTRTASGSDDFLSLTASKDAQVGNYAVQVDALAASHKLSSASIDSAEAIGEGTLTFNSGSNNFDIAVSNTDTLSDIRDAINDSVDNESVLATIITDDTGEHLVLTSKETGVANAITITVDDVSDGNDTDNLGLSRLAYDPAALPTAITNLTQVQAATDAQITIDNTITITSTTNEFKDVIDGIDITAKKVHDIDDDDSQIAISENNNNIAAGLNTFIKSYNELLELSNSLGSVGDAGVGPLAGDSLLRGVMSKLRNELSEAFDSGNGETLTLSQLGVTGDRYGVLSLDSEILNDAIDNDVDAVQNFFVGVSDDGDGFAGGLDNLLGFYTESDGIIQGRLDSKEDQLDRLDEDRETFTRKMESLEARLYAQYNAMDLLVAGLNSTSTYLMAQLENMPGVVKKDN